jgi:hypothetical protein
MLVKCVVSPSARTVCLVGGWGCGCVLDTEFQPHIITCLLDVASALWHWRITDDLGLCEPLSALDDVTGVLFDWIGSAIQYMAMADYPCALQHPWSLALSR